MTMFPMKGVNPRQMERMMRQMGMKVEEIESVSKVVIFSEKGDITITDPQVTKTKVMGQTMYQIAGEGKIGEASADESAASPPAGVSDEDVELVATQASTSREKARDALENADGDIAEAILSLTQ
jgi:nascent polypeptide-associated complex subunit alpha